MKMNNLYLAIVLILSTALSASAADPEKPNVVFFLIDDLGRNDCGFMGGTEIDTPHIDKLAAAGSKLDAFYVQPVCSPTRAALLTGRYPMRYGLQVGVVRPWADYGLPLDETTMAEDLQKAGYTTGIVGKWHLGHITREYLPTSRGFDHQYGHYNGAIDYFTHERDGGDDWRKNDRPLEEEGYATTLLGRRATQFVRDNAGEKPFFLYVPFNAVHSPYHAPEKYLSRYPDMKGKRQAYAAMLTATDDAIGEIVKAVEEAGVRDKTLFVFSSDNGGPAPGRVTDNGKYRGGKGGLYEGGVRVAAFATWDGHIPAGSTNVESMHIVDWRPTLLRLCGGEQSDDAPLDGRDIWRTLSDGSPSPHEFILLNTAPEKGAIRVGDWKLIVNKDRAGGKRRKSRKGGGAKVELFNLRNDPYEKTNLAEQRPEKVKELRRELNRLAKEAAPPKRTPMPEDYAAPKIWGPTG